VGRTVHNGEFISGTLPRFDDVFGRFVIRVITGETNVRLANRDNLDALKSDVAFVGHWVKRNSLVIGYFHNLTSIPASAMLGVKTKRLNVFRPSQRAGFG
jgi:hypothetical protein